MTEITITAKYDETETTFDEITDSIMQLGFIDFEITEKEIKDEQG